MEPDDNNSLPQLANAPDDDDAELDALAETSDKQERIIMAQIRARYPELYKFITAEDGQATQ